MGWGGGPCDFSVSPSPFGLDFGTLDLDFGLGLDNSISRVSVCVYVYIFPLTHHIPRKLSTLI